MLAALLFATAGERARSDDFPSRNITIIVSQAVGGGNDILARLFAERLQARLGKPVVVENRVGAGGMIGATAGARAAPDG
ncbi:MAG TPA: tripartite tricarboxylate transporter substrate-binding protein, partial [Xanthobacteraceae bacterium]|nr:tripartite tricarboxylate transporter substrate-binding protein [Xanthobacteraceae bacterium]